MYKKYYELFLKANEGVQHFAAHSHHFWPDVTREAMLRYWDDSARLTDDKWDYFFSEKVPAVQRLIAGVLNLSRPEQIVFAPNTHELVYRLLSCYDGRKEVKVLTTDSEFHSFERQINRLGERAGFMVDKIPTQDYVTFQERFIRQIQSQHYDLIFFSQVFFNSGVTAGDLEKIVKAVADPNTVIAVDGYHAFMALPTDLRALEKRIFYIAGSYKYAQGGEGCCFMHVPVDCRLRPAFTGWFAGFGQLAAGPGEAVAYAEDGYRFAGSTMDFSGLYRLQAALELFAREGITVAHIHGHIRSLQTNFRRTLRELEHPVLKEENILRRDFTEHGHFYAFETLDADKTRRLHDELRAKGIRTDYRGTRLRFGFGLYQDECIRWTP